MSNYKLWLLLTAVLLFAACGFYGLGRESRRIYRALDDFERSAIVTDDRLKLDELEVALRQFVLLNCWHYHHKARSREVLAFIRGKLHARN